MSDLLFGLNVSPAVAPGVDPVADARRAEELGFDFVSVNDHLHGESPRHETWTLLSWIAAGTSRIHVASRVLGVPYRNPAVTAKMAETFDRLSGGRLILGLGGGAVDEEFRAFGLGDEWPPRDKVDGLEEAIRIARGLWSEPSFTFHGRLYRTEGAQLEPKPDLRIPIWLGTYGDRALALTGSLADGWIPSLELVPPERAIAMRGRILGAAREAGREPQEITCVYNLDVRVEDRPSGEPEPFVVSGTPDAVADRLAGFVKIGFTAFNFLPAGPGTEEQVERLAREVIPAVRTAA
jgi:alkanesulfonate monooxygenase SsuD/methylene tetrahydromethanopterin reductase-like flavin-dependent oxidoreductase (luciferase family)